MQHDHEVKLSVSEELKARVDRINKYVQDNKTTFLVGAGCLATGYLLRQPQTAMTNLVVNEGPRIASTSSPDIKGCVWIADHVMNKIKSVGMAEVTMETGEIIGLYKEGMK